MSFGACFLCGIDRSLLDHAVQIQGPVIGLGLFSSRYFCPGDCHFVCSVVSKECAYDCFWQIYIQRQLVPRGIVIEIRNVCLFFVSKTYELRTLSQFYIL